MKGYITSEAVIVGVESGTSSPIRIPRDPQTLQHPDVEGLFPCGEGASYAGGIVSAAMDGQRVAAACGAVVGGAPRWILWPKTQSCVYPWAMIPRSTL